MQHLGIFPKPLKRRNPDFGGYFKGLNKYKKFEGSVIWLISHLLCTTLHGILVENIHFVTTLGYLRQNMITHIQQYYDHHLHPQYPEKYY